MTVLYWSIIVVGCLVIGFTAGSVFTKIKCGKMLAVLEAMGALNIPEEYKDEKNRK